MLSCIYINCVLFCDILRLHKPGGGRYALRSLSPSVYICVFVCIRVCSRKRLGVEDPEWPETKMRNGRMTNTRTSASTHAHARAGENPIKRKRNAPKHGKSALKRF